MPLFELDIYKGMRCICFVGPNIYALMFKIYLKTFCFFFKKALFSFCWSVGHSAQSFLLRFFLNVG